MMNNRKKILIPVKESVRNYLNALTELDCDVTVSDILCDPVDFDGLLLPGGEDVHPERYNEEVDGSMKMDPELDELQLQTMDLFVKAGKPVFGICRGHQLINVYFGGTLYQDMENAKHHVYDHVNQKDNRHLNTAEEGSFIYDLYGGEFATNSSHHQAVKKIGEGLHACQYADDGTIEAMYHETLPICSVQWHPERMCFALKRDDTVDGSLVLRYFLEEMCKQ
ncbi:MAG: gamma-glutamyl-gamma-aminobutyrate hydrolase family protein [Erysipelotrichaceae bacterium]|nr:gamma-glutamyl-gamma-aminobutyrate hydrolase family protein [Erysipelotrichaceae bacterium]